MKTGIARAFSTLAVLGAAAFAQFTPEEIAARGEIERFLLAAPIVASKPLGEGVTGSLKVTLRLGSVERSAVWKGVTGSPLGVPDEWRYEIAAYRMDKLLGLNMIPPTVEKEMGGRKGSLQLWAETECSLLDVMDKGLEVDPAAAGPMARGKYIVRAFDSLIANVDRTQQNIRYTCDWRTILIDHSRSFRSSNESAESLLYGRRGTRKTADGRPFSIRSLPREFLRNMKALTRETVASAMGVYLTRAEIGAVLSRRDLLVKDIEDLIVEQGEAEVLY